MSAAAIPCLALGFSAWAIAAIRVFVLTWSAPVDAPRLASTLERMLASGDRARAVAVCRGLAGGWAAECAERLLCAREQDAAALDFCVDELRASYRLRAHWGIGALRGLGRMAFPLALASAIVVMGRAFADADVLKVEAALDSALQCLTLGVMSAVISRSGAAIVQRQGGARLQEIAAVCRGLRAALIQKPPTVQGS